MGRRPTRPGTQCRREARIELLEQPRYVGRGGLKLEAALDHFGIHAAGKICLDVGSSTGGFTDCLLQRGAARVYAIDVGTGQLDWKLRNDPRVIVQEQVNARYLTRDRGSRDHRPGGLRCQLHLHHNDSTGAAGLLAENAEMVILVKPQFELEREQVGKGGIIRDPALHQQACQRVEEAVQRLGFQTDIIPSPVLGAEGNQEFLLYARH